MQPFGLRTPMACWEISPGLSARNPGVLPKQQCTPDGVQGSSVPTFATSLLNNARDFFQWALYPGLFFLGLEIVLSHTRLRRLP